MAHYVFDLDGTIADSRHRIRLNPDGTLDLAAWRETAREWDYVARDTILPLSQLWRAAWRNGHFVHVCTSRVISPADEQWLRENDLPYVSLMSRDISDDRACVPYKIDHFRQFMARYGSARPIMFFDDSRPIVDAINSEFTGIISAHCAHKWNKFLSSNPIERN